MEIATQDTGFAKWSLKVVWLKVRAAFWPASENILKYKRGNSAENSRYAEPTNDDECLGHAQRNTTGRRDRQVEEKWISNLVIFLYWRTRADDLLDGQRKKKSQTIMRYYNKTVDKWRWYTVYCVRIKYQKKWNNNSCTVGENKIQKTKGMRKAKLRNQEERCLSVRTLTVKN